MDELQRIREMQELERIRQMQQQAMQNLSAQTGPPAAQEPGLLEQAVSEALRSVKNIGSVVGPVETGLNLLTSVYGVPASGLAGLGGLAAGGVANLFSPKEGRPLDWATKAQQAVQGATIYQPQTQPGQELTQDLAYPFQQWSEQVAQPATEASRVAFGPEVAVAVGTAIEGAPLLLGIKPGKGKTPSELITARKQLVKEGFPVTKGTLLERVTEKIPPGSWFHEKWQKKLNTMVKEANERFTTERMGLPDPAMIPEFKATSDAAWTAMRNVVQKDATFSAPNLRKWIQDNPTEMNALKVSKDKTLYSYLTRAQKAGDNVLFTELNKINETVWGQNFNKLPPAERRIRWEIQKALKDDIKNIQETKNVPVWDRYMEAMEQSKVVHQAESAAFVEGLFKRATQLDKDKGVTIFYPDQFKKAVEQSQGSLKRMFKNNPEALDMINAYADKMMGAAADLMKYKNQKPGSFLERMATGGLGGYGLYKAGQYAVENPLAGAALILPYGAETWLASSLAKPGGFMKKWIFAEPGKAARKAVRPFALGALYEAQEED